MIKPKTHLKIGKKSVKLSEFLRKAKTSHVAQPPIEVKSENEEQKKNAAAVKIQATYRGMQIRKGLKAVRNIQQDMIENNSQKELENEIALL